MTSSAGGPSPASTRSSGGNATDCHGHGTHVAGTAAGSSYGVAKQARIYSVRVLGCDGTGSVSQIVAGVNWVTNNAVKPAVANMSLSGGSWFTGAIDDAVNNSISRGITYVVAAGNDDASACDRTPARVPAAITVGATTMTDARASFSNYGSCVDLFAPGVSITSAFRTSDTATTTMNGTSMAAPHVAGAAAIILSANPTWTTGPVAKRLYADATNGVVSDPSGSPNRLLYAGTANTKPIITRLQCDSGNSQFLCTLSYHVWSGSVSVSWNLNGVAVPGWNGQTAVNGSCTTSTVLQAVVSNSQGSGTQSWSQCRTGPFL
jgi:subtilisin family serine protease